MPNDCSTFPFGVHAKNRSTCRLFTEPFSSNPILSILYTALWVAGRSIDLPWGVANGFPSLVLIGNKLLYEQTSYLVENWIRLRKEKTR